MSIDRGFCLSQTIEYVDDAQTRHAVRVATDNDGDGVYVPIRDVLSVVGMHINRGRFIRQLVPVSEKIKIYCAPVVKRRGTGDSRPSYALTTRGLRRLTQIHRFTKHPTFVRWITEYLIPQMEHLERVRNGNLLLQLRQERIDSV